jgi:hypothetical protein
MIAVRCNRCLNDMYDPGALFFTPPDSYDMVRKLHICRFCLPVVLRFIEGQ